MLASDYSKTLGSLPWLAFFFFPPLFVLFLVFYSFGGGFPYDGFWSFPHGPGFFFGGVFVSVFAFLWLALDY